MAPEEQNLKCSSASSCAGVIIGGGGGGSSSSTRLSRRLRRKRFPQRGLGVAHLEKLRLEEQLKKEEEEASVDTCLRLISPLLSVRNLRLEHPSNQSHYGNNNNPFGNEEEKETFLKRQYPFSLQISPRSLDKDFQGTSTILRGSSSSGLQYETNSRRITLGNDSLDYGFLTLAPPTSTPAYQESPRTTMDFFEDPIGRPNTSESSSGSSGHQPFFCFFPMPNVENGWRITGESSSSSGEVGETVDLNLKL